MDMGTLGRAASPPPGVLTRGRLQVKASPGPQRSCPSLSPGGTRLVPCARPGAACWEVVSVKTPV